MQKLPTTPGMWNEEESEYVINGAPVTVMLPALTPRNEEEIAEVCMVITHVMLTFRINRKSSDSSVIEAPSLQQPELQHILNQSSNTPYMSPPTASHNFTRVSFVKLGAARELTILPGVLSAV